VGSEACPQAARTARDAAASSRIDGDELTEGFFFGVAPSLEGRSDWDMVAPPDFFLDATETGDPRELRACWLEGRLRDSSRDDYMLVRIDPPLIGQPYGLGDRDIERVLLATRHAGRTLFPVTEWPAFVYVLRVLDDTVLKTKMFSANHVQMIRWAILHKERQGSGS